MYVHVFVVRFLSFVTIMEEVSLSSEEEVVAVDPKFQRFGASLERALRTFEISREWHDLISALTRLHKVSHDRLDHSCLCSLFLLGSSSLYAI